MKTSCKKAATYGDERLKSPSQPIRHITVILNPVACKRKSKKLYTKWVEPLFHLAGIKVSLVETASPNQARDLMKIMSNCDGVAIVGGDGTVHEALNGLLSRPDCAEAVANFPIGIIPAGQYNSVARYIHQNHMIYRNQKEFLIEATMRVVDSLKQRFDVIKITPLNQDQTDAFQTGQSLVAQGQDTSSPIYALRDLRYGIYQDNFFKTSGYYRYQNYIKPIWLRIQRAFSRKSKYPSPQIESLSYTRPCEGCSTCYEKHRLHGETPVQDKEPSANRRWWSKVAPVRPSAPTDEEKRQLELSKRENPDCQTWVAIGNLGEISDMRACMMGEKKVRLSLSRQREYSPSDVSEVQDVRMKLVPEFESGQLQSSQNGDEMAEGKGDDPHGKKPVQFLVDGQPTPARSVEITAIEHAITVFTGPHKTIIPDKPRSRTR